MTKRRDVARVRCLHCGMLAPSMVLGRCPRCLSIDSALAADWTVDSALVRQIVRHDKTRLALYVRKEGSSWCVHAIETDANDKPCICRVTRRDLLPAALEAAEAFGRRWLEGAPGTAIATYVERPTETVRTTRST